MMKLTHPNGYTGVLYGKNSMAIYDKDGKRCLHTNSRVPNTKSELYEALADMPKLMKVLNGERTEDEDAVD